MKNVTNNTLPTESSQGKNHSTPWQPLHKIHVPRKEKKREETLGTSLGMFRPESKANANQGYKTETHPMPGPLAKLNEEGEREKKKKTRKKKTLNTPCSDHPRSVGHAHFKPKSPFAFGLAGRSSTPFAMPCNELHPYVLSKTKQTKTVLD